MDFKNEICATFKRLRSAERIDLLCGLFHLSVPLELRFIGSCLEDLIRRNHLTQIDFEGKANNNTFNGDIKLNVLSRDLFHEISLYMSFLHSDNTNSARAYFKVLEHIKCSIDFQIDQLEPPTFQFDNCVIADIELMYTMAIHHPAFSYEDRIKLYKYLKQLQLTFKEMKSSQKSEEEKSDEDVGSTSSSLSSVKSEVTSKEEMIVEQGQQDSNDIQTLLLNNDKVSDDNSSLPNNAIKHQTESPQGLLTEIRLKDISVKRCVPKYECCIEAVLSDGSVINITKSYSDIKSYFNSIFGNKYSKPDHSKSEINGLNFPLENVENVKVLQDEMNLYFRKLLPQVQNPAMTSAMLRYFFKTKIGVEDSLTVQMLTSCPSKRDGINVQNCNTEPSTDDSSHAGNKSHLQSFTVYNSQLSSSAQRKFRLGRHRVPKEPNSPTALGSTNRHVPPLRGQGDPAGTSTSSVRAYVSPSVASPCISNSTAASLNSSCCSSRSDSPTSGSGQPMLANGGLIKTNNLTNCKYIEDRTNKDAKIPLVHNQPDQKSLIMNSQHSALLPFPAATRPLYWHIAQTVQPEFIETKGPLGPPLVDPNMMMERKTMVDGRGEIVNSLEGVHSEVSMLPLIGHIPDCILPQQPPSLPYYQPFNPPPSADLSTVGVRKSGVDVATEAFPSANSIPARHSPPAVHDNSAVLPSHKNVRPILGSNSNHVISCKSKPVKSTSAPPLPAVTSQNAFSVSRSPPMPVSSNQDIVPQLAHAPRPASLNAPSNPQAANSLKTRSFAAVAANRRDSPGPPPPPPLPPSISAGFPPLSQVFPVKQEKNFPVKPEKNFPVRPPSNVPTPLPSPSSTPPVPQSNGSGSAAGTPCATSCTCMQCMTINQFPMYGPGPSHFYYSLPYGFPLNANGFVASPHNFAVQPPSAPSQVPVRFSPRFVCSQDFIINISNGFPPGFQQQYGQPPMVPNPMMFPAGAPYSRPLFNPSIPPPNFVQGQQPQSVAAMRPPLKPVRRMCCANCGSNDHRVESCPDSLMAPPGPQNKFRLNRIPRSEQQT